MKALTETQPAASLAAAGVITLLATPDPIDYRGRVALHAAEEWERGEFARLVGGDVGMASGRSSIGGSR